MKVVIIKYNAGNLQSVSNALERLEVDYIISDRAEEIQNADKVIFPGVGEAASAMRYLRDRNLDQVICNLKQPVLGICIGLQLLCASSEEASTKCMGIFSEKVKLFQVGLKVPHIGWNTISQLDGPLFDGIQESAYVYFVHSYYAELGVNTQAVTSYEHGFSAALVKDNFYAIQFHAEKSSVVGSKILNNFLVNT